MMGLSGLNRKAMEEERLARVARKRLLEQTVEEEKYEVILKKQKRKTDASPLPRSQDLLQIEKSKLKAGSKVQLSLLHDSSLQDQTKEKLKLGILYPDGVVKKTWVRGFPRRGDDIKIEEVLQKDNLTLAVLSAFQIDSDWIMGKLEDKTRVYWVLQAKTSDEDLLVASLHLDTKQNWTSQAPSNYKFCFPSMVGNINCMHSKLQLLAHPSHLRVVVPSANLVPHDWGESGSLENMCFIIDLPRHEDGRNSSWEDLTHFGQELTYFLEAKGLPEQVVKSLRKFDFSRSAKFGFVHSIGGSHTGVSYRRTGYCGLASTVNRLGLQTNDPILIDFITASMGKITPKFIEKLYLAAQGIVDLTSNKTQKPLGDSKAKLQKYINDFCRIYFPTRETVEKSLGGSRAGGTICFQSKWWSSNHFLERIICDSESRREGVLTHSKMWFVRPYKPCSRQSWAYIGSANLSESAWGRLDKDMKTKQPKLNCANWECGVIYPVSPIGVEEEVKSERMAEFRGHIPISMVVPGAAYEGRGPWLFN